jgi:hypothetical protein
MDIEWVKKQQPLAEWFTAYSEAAEDDDTMLVHRDTMLLIMQGAWVHPERVTRLALHMRMVQDDK